MVSLGTVNDSHVIVVLDFSRSCRIPSTIFMLLSLKDFKISHIFNIGYQWIASI